MPLRGALRKRIINKNVIDSEMKVKKIEIKKAEQQILKNKKELKQLSKGEIPKKGKTPEKVSIVPEKDKLDWTLEIFTAVFIIGGIAMSGINVDNFLTKLPDFAAMQSYLLFGILLQLVKIGRKI